MIKKALDKKIPVITEVELAYLVSKPQLLGLLEPMVKQQQQR